MVRLSRQCGAIFDSSLAFSSCLLILFCLSARVTMDDQVDYHSVTITYKVKSTDKVPLRLGNLIHDFNLSHLVKASSESSSIQNREKVQLSSIDRFTLGAKPPVSKFDLFPANQLASRFIHVERVDAKNQLLILYRSIDIDQVCQPITVKNASSNEDEAIPGCRCVCDAKQSTLPYCELILTTTLLPFNDKLTLYIIKITFSEINDKRPTFPDHTNYRVSFKETDQIGTRVILQLADDRDVCHVNSLIHYRLAPPSTMIDDSGIFALKQTEQNETVVKLELELTGQLDRETKASHTLLLLAYNPTTLKSSDLALTSTLILNVDVQDVNDCRPIFVQYDEIYHRRECFPPTQPDSQSTPMLLTIGEDIDVGHVLYQLEAYDGDVGRNAELHFEFGVQTHPQTRQVFNLNRSSGQITVASQLDREKSPLANGRHFIQVIALDHGSPPRSSSMALLIELTDVNDNRPIINLLGARSNGNDQSEFSIDFTSNMNGRPIKSDNQHIDQWSIVGPLIQVLDNDLDENGTVDCTIADTHINPDRNGSKVISDQGHGLVRLKRIVIDTTGDTRQNSHDSNRNADSGQTTFAFELSMSNAESTNLTQIKFRLSCHDHGLPQLTSIDRSVTFNLVAKTDDSSSAKVKYSHLYWHKITIVSSQVSLIDYSQENECLFERQQRSRVGQFGDVTGERSSIASIGQQERILILPKQQRKKNDSDLKVCLKVQLTVGNEEREIELFKVDVRSVDDMGNHLVEFQLGDSTCTGNSDMQLYLDTLKGPTAAVLRLTVSRLPTKSTTTTHSSTSLHCMAVIRATFDKHTSEDSIQLLAFINLLNPIAEIVPTYSSSSPIIDRYTATDVTTDVSIGEGQPSKTRVEPRDLVFCCISDAVDDVVVECDMGMTMLTGNQSIYPYHAQFNAFGLELKGNGCYRLVSLVEFDREARSSYQLRLEAGLTALHLVRVTILDVNDNAPLLGHPFTPPTWSSGQLTFTRSPARHPHDYRHVCRVDASDRDEGDNGRLTFHITNVLMAGQDDVASIESRNFGVGRAFRMDKTTGAITAHTDLAVGRYLLKLVVIDHGSPKLSTTGLLYINITDDPTTKGQLQQRPINDQSDSFLVNGDRSLANSDKVDSHPLTINQRPDRTSTVNQLAKPTPNTGSHSFASISLISSTVVLTSVAMICTGIACVYCMIVKRRMRSSGGRIFTTPVDRGATDRQMIESSHIEMMMAGNVHDWTSNVNQIPPSPDPNVLLGFSSDPETVAAGLHGNPDWTLLPGRVA